MPTSRKMLSARISEKQWDELSAYLAQIYPHFEVAEYVRFAIRQEMKSSGFGWTFEDFVSNKKRSKRGIPWEPYKKRWKKGQDD